MFLLIFDKFILKYILQGDKKVNSSPRVPFVTQDSRFVNENLLL